MSADPQQHDVPQPATRQAARGRLARGFVPGIVRAFDHLLPRRCLLCELACGSEPLCPPCREALPGAGLRRCAACGRSSSAALACPACRAHRPAFDRVLTIGDYAPPFAEAIRALKFGGQTALAWALGALLAERLAVEIAAEMATAMAVEMPTAIAADPSAEPAATASLARIDALVPVPLSGRRLAERGFNQAQLIAAVLARRWPAAPAPTLKPGWLARRGDAPPQSSLAFAQRRRNVAGSFVAAPAVAGLRIGLVDDVMTTGATLDAAAQALRSAGALAVVAFVAARTPFEPGGDAAAAGR